MNDRNAYYCINQTLIDNGIGVSRENTLLLLLPSVGKMPPLTFPYLSNNRKPDSIRFDFAASAFK